MTTHASSGIRPQRLRRTPVDLIVVSLIVAPAISIASVWWFGERYLDVAFSYLGGVPVGPLIVVLYGLARGARRRAIVGLALASLLVVCVLVAGYVLWVIIELGQTMEDFD